MSPFMVWVADHLGTVLVVGFLVATGALLVGARATWKTALRLRAPPRPWLGLGASLVMLLAGGGGMLLFGSGLIEVAPGLRAQRGMIGHPAPELPFLLVESDQPGRLGDFEGRLVLVNMWATWCPPCIEEMPELDRLHRTYADAGLVVLHLSDEDRETLVDWLDERPSSTVHAYAQPIAWPESGRPTTFVIDREGIVRRVLLGARSFEQFEAEIADYL